MIFQWHYLRDCYNHASKSREEREREREREKEGNSPASSRDSDGGKVVKCFMPFEPIPADPAL